MIAATTAWFDTHRSTAVSLARSRSARGGADDHVAVRAVVDLGVRLAQRDVDHRRAGLQVVLLPAGLLGAPPCAPIAAEEAQRLALRRRSEGRRHWRKCFRTPQFLVLGLTYFACCAAHAGPIFHMVSYAMFCGIAPMAAVSIYSVEGAAGLVGRLLFGVLADRLGVKPVLVAGLLLQAVAICL